MTSVSVVIPTYQRREPLLEALACVLAQTLEPLEVIVVDDGSTDGTEEAVRALGAPVDYVWQQNRGASAARNAGIRRARGDVFAFLDSDDRWLPGHLHGLVAALERHEEAVLAVTTPHPHLEAESGTLLDLFPPLLSGLGLLGSPTHVAVRADALASAGGFDEGLPVAEDSELWVRLAAAGPFAVTETRTVVRRLQGDSLQSRGAEEGLYPGAWHRLSRRGVRLAEARGPGSDAVRHARAGLAWAEALVALAAADEEGARRSLREACLLAPRLSLLPELVLLRMANGSRPARRRWTLASAAAMWPDRESPTARALDHHARRARLLDTAELHVGWCAEPVEPTATQD
jgi:hypothetical protein